MGAVAKRMVTKNLPHLNVPVSPHKKLIPPPPPMAEFPGTFRQTASIK